MSQFLGQTLGERYRILSLLGSGGMGDVYLAEHVMLGKRMAVKVLKAEMTRDEELVRRFQQEAIAASRIGHENIVSVTDFGRANDAFYFVMEALSGQDLGALIRAEGILPLRRSLAILIQVSRALGAAHAQDIVHRDLKSENVMVLPRDDGTDLIKVLDFGISKMSAAAEGSNPRLTRAGMLMGTPNYMSPEQARGDAVDARSDIYSFGVLTYELLTATVPFSAPNLTGVLLKHITDIPEPPSRRAPGHPVAPALEGLVMQMLEKDPVRRPQTMGAVREGLAAALRAAGGDAGSTPRRGGVAPIQLVHPAPISRTYMLPSEGGSGVAPVASGASTEAASSAAPPRLQGLQINGRGRGRRSLWVVATLVLAVGLSFAAGLFILRKSAVAPQPVVAAPASPPPMSAAIPRPVVPAPEPGLTSPPAAVTPAPVAPSSMGDRAPAPEVTLAKPALSPLPIPLKPLTERRVVEVFQKSGAALRRCLQDNRASLPGKNGALSVGIVVLKSGMVKEVSVTPGTPDGPLARCVSRCVEKMRFGPHKEAAAAFEIPLQYDSRD